MTISNALRFLAVIVLLATAGPLLARNYGAQTGGVDALERAFKQPPDDARIMMRWWWYGPAVAKAELEREMRLMKEGGIGGFEVQPVYPLALDDATKGIKTLPFLSDEFLDALRFTADKSRELGLRMDLTLGSGWPFGGPTVPVSLAAARLRVERVKLGGAQAARVPLPALAEGEKLIAAFLGSGEITDFKDGALWLPAQPANSANPERQSEVRFFISSRTGQQVKRPAVGVVIATRRRPSIAPGFRATEAENNQVRDIARRLFEGSAAMGHFVEDENRGLANKLTSLLRPDVALSSASAEIGFIHRHTDAAEIYFLANTSNARQQVTATFRLRQMQAEWWNPFDGSVTPAEAQATEDGGIKVALDLEPYGSRVLVFSGRKLSPLPTVTASVQSPIDLSGGWQVSFGQNNPAPMDKLRSWTESEETRYFSGVATYEKTVAVPDAMLERGAEVLLDFGEGLPVPARPLKNGMRAFWDAPVRDAAVAYVNGERAGAVWCPPYSINVTKLLKRGQNRIRIVVGNTAINYLAGHRLPDYRLLNLRYGVRFEPQDMENLQPLPSGLLGTVRLVTPGGR